MRNSKGQFIKGANLGNTNGFKKGQISFMKGKKHKPESIEKMKQSHKGQNAWNKGTKGLIKSNSGSFKKGEHRSSQTEFKKGLTPWNKNLKGYLAGEKNPFWKNNAMKNYPELEQIRKSPEYVKVMRETKKRDDYRCFWCGERGGKLHSDHILPFIDYPRLRLEPNNIQTLCVPCHKIKTKGDRIGIYVFN